MENVADQTDNVAYDIVCENAVYGNAVMTTLSQSNFSADCIWLSKKNKVRSWIFYILAASSVRVWLQ